MGLVIEDGNGFDTMLLEKLEQRPEAADVTLTDECFDVCYYLDCCKTWRRSSPPPLFPQSGRRRSYQAF